MDFQAILDNVAVILQPNGLGDFFIYTIFILMLIANSRLPDKKNDMPNYISLVVIVLCIVDKLRSAPGFELPVPGFDDEGFGTLIIHVGMAVLPFVAAGMVRLGGGKKGRIAPPLSIMAGFAGTLYAIGSFLSPELFYA